MTTTVLKHMKQNIVFEVFWNEHKETEFAIQIVKNVKSMIFTSSKRLVITAQCISHHLRRLIMSRLKHSLHKELKS